MHFEIIWYFVNHHMIHTEDDYKGELMLSYTHTSPSAFPLLFLCFSKIQHNRFIIERINTQTDTRTHSLTYRSSLSCTDILLKIQSKRITPTIEKAHESVQALICYYNYGCLCANSSHVHLEHSKVNRSPIFARLTAQARVAASRAL